MILAIESSIPEASLALFDRESGEVVWREGFTSQRAHNAVIFEPLSAALERCGRHLDLVVVGRGPGSYGGVRVGIAVANGISLALGAPVIGLSSLEAMETEAAEFAVIGDARRQSYFVARIVGGGLQGEPELVSEEELKEHLARLSGQEIPVFTSDQALSAQIEGVELARPMAGRLAIRAAGLDESEWGRRAAEPLEPHYLRAPYITTPKV